MYIVRPIRLQLFIFLLLNLAILIFANAQTRIGITGGINFSNAYIEDNMGNTSETEYTSGVRIGITVDVPLFSVFYIQPAVVFSQKGYKQDYNWFSGMGNEFEAEVSYIEVPIDILYKSEWGVGKLVLGAGPYFAYGLSGQWQTKWDINFGGLNLKGSGDVIFEKDGSNAEFNEFVYGRPLDYGANLKIGYDFWNTISVQILGQFGMNLQPEWNGQRQKDIFKNRTLNISLGYKF